MNDQTPKQIVVAGFGFTSNATPESFAQALEATGYKDKIDLLATPSDKALQPAFLDFGRAQRLIANAVTRNALEAAETKTQSFLSRLMRRTGSVAEAAALAAAGPGSTLIVTRQISNDRMATCAIAKGADA
ncbi:cobalamin biosynthesis protein [Tateyamaria sp.]|uniref:cobalamin biosynthesis protein n=1 Tax=Tateyamaria sp. TaxID=1929288 RepID=UPI00329EE94D